MESIYRHWRLSFTIGKVWNVSATHSFNSTCSVPKRKYLLTQAIVCTNTNIKKAATYDCTNTNTKYKKIYLLTEAGAMINGETIDYNSPPRRRQWVELLLNVLPFCRFANDLRTKIQLRATLLIWNCSKTKEVVDLNKKKLQFKKNKTSPSSSFSLRMAAKMEQTEKYLHPEKIAFAIYDVKLINHKSRGKSQIFGRNSFWL